MEPHRARRSARRRFGALQVALSLLVAFATSIVSAAPGIAVGDPAFPPEARSALEAALASAEAAVASPKPWSPDAPAWRTALDDVRHLTSVAAEHPAAWRLSLRVHVLVGWTARALEAAEAWRAVGGAPDWADADPPAPTGPPSVALLRRAQAELAFARYQAGAVDAAIDAFDALLVDHPGDLEAWRWLGRLWLEAGDATAALPYWRAVVDADPDDAGARHFLTLTELAVQVGPAASRAFGDGVAAFEAGRFADAAVAFAAARAAAPSFVEAHVWSARAALAVGSAVDAIGHFEEALRLSPDDPALGYLLEVARSQREHGIEAGQAYHDALAAWRDGDLERARADLERATAAAPAYLDAARALATVLQEMGALTEAEAAWQRVIAIAPGDERATAAINVLREQRAYGGSEAAATAYALGVAAFERFDFVAAERHFLDVVALDARSVRAWVWLGRLAFDRGAYLPAAEAFERALALDPSDADVAWFAAEARARLTPTDSP